MTVVADAASDVFGCGPHPDLLKSPRIRPIGHFLPRFRGRRDNPAHLQNIRVGPALADATIKDQC